jgi:hypothetical protein
MPAKPLEVGWVRTCVKLDSKRQLLRDEINNCAYWKQDGKCYGINFSQNILPYQDEYMS